MQVQATLFPDNRGDLADLADLAQGMDALALNFFFLVCTGRGVTQTEMPEPMYEETLAAIIALQVEHPQLMIRARCAPYTRRLLGLQAGEARGGYAGWSSACLAGRSYLRITPQGRVTPCPYIPEVVGDLRAESLGDIWTQSATLQRLRGDLPAGKCGDCDFRYSCGGCRARAVASSGNLLGEDSKCSHVRLPGALPEPAPRPESEGSGIGWDPAAQALLDRIPAFVRERVRARLEEKAYAAGLSAVSAEFLHANRPAGLAGMRPRSSSTRPATESAASMHAAVDTPPR